MKKTQQSAVKNYDTDEVGGQVRTETPLSSECYRSE